MLDIEDGVAVIRLNRPERANAITSAMGDLYVQTLERVEHDPAVRVVIVTGSGKAFCAGADMAALDDAGKDADPGSTSRLDTASLEQSYLRPWVSRKPYIAAINGACVGVGAAIAMGCDVRFIARDAAVAMSFARLGLVADFGLSWLLPRIMGVTNTMDLLLSGRRITGEEAAQLGFASDALPADEVLSQTISYAKDVAANCSPQSMATIKQQVFGDLDATLEASYARSVERMKEAFAGADLSEGVRAFSERRAPNFGPLNT